MTHRRINILLCDTFPGRLPDFIPNYESLFMDLFAAVGEQVSYKIYQKCGGIEGTFSQLW